MTNSSPTPAAGTTAQDAPLDCELCPRLVEFRRKNEELYPDFFNAPVPSFGDVNHELMVVGLAPGLKGANQTGRPFTGDYAGDLLYATLAKFNYAIGTYGGTAEDGLILENVIITNAVRCVPPQNKTIALEENNCRPFLINQIKGAPKLKIILSLGLVAHNAVLKTFEKKKSVFKFAHGAIHDLGDDMGQNIAMINSYHCSRYNTNTGRLTTEMFEDVFKKIDVFLIT